MLLENKEKIGTVHDAVVRATQESEAKNSVVISAKVSEKIHELASEICEAHGITLSAYLRSCLEILVEDYASGKT